MAMHPQDEIGRRKPVHFPTIEAFNRSTAVFVTICTKDRLPLLARPEIHSLLHELWIEIADWLVADYVLLPDHLHFFCAPSSPDAPELARWIRYWKSIASRRWPHPNEKPPWQMDFWDTQLRSSEHYTAKWEYVRQNPVRHRLVERADDWPYQGRVFELLWHDSA
jgi:REP-associated tyrosine transposase